MKYLLKIISRYGINIFILHGLVYTQAYKYGVFTSPPELENVFVDENGLGDAPAESQWGPALSNTFGDVKNG